MAWKGTSVGSNTFQMKRISSVNHFIQNLVCSCGGGYTLNVTHKFGADLGKNHKYEQTWEKILNIEQNVGLNILFGVKISRVERKSNRNINLGQDLELTINQGNFERSPKFGSKIKGKVKKLTIWGCRFRGAHKFGEESMFRAEIQEKQNFGANLKRKTLNWGKFGKPLILGLN